MNQSVVRILLYMILGGTLAVGGITVFGTPWLLAFVWVLVLGIDINAEYNK